MQILNNKRIYLGIFLTIVLGFSINLVLASNITVQPGDVNVAPSAINPNIPGTNSSTLQNPNPGNIIGNFYQFALLIGGLLAFIIIVFAAIKHTVSADNPSGQSDAKDMIKQALLGLLLLAGAYLILNTINPKLTNLSLPTLNTIDAPSQGIACSKQADCGAAFATCSPAGRCIRTIGGSCSATSPCKDPYICVVSYDVVGGSYNPPRCLVPCSSDDACYDSRSGIYVIRNTACESPAGMLVVNGGAPAESSAKVCFPRN